MSVSQRTPNVSQMTGAQAVVDSLVRHGITAGFGIPSIHNIAVYEALRQRRQPSQPAARVATPAKPRKGLGS